MPSSLTKLIGSIPHWRIILTRRFAPQLVTAEELRHLNHELKTRRRAKLREFYMEQEEVYEKELNEMGLAFVKARV